MKKLLLAAAASAVLSASAASADCAYLTINGGGAYMPKLKDSLIGADLAEKYTALGSIGAGYQYDAFRAELTLSHMLDSVQSYSNDKHQFKNYAGADVVKGKLEAKRDFCATALLANVYADVATSDVMGLFVGAGVGGAYVKQKVTVEHAVNATDAKVADTYASPLAMAEKEPAETSYTLAYRGTVGATFAVSEGVNLDIAYSYNHYGDVTKFSVAQTIKTDDKDTTVNRDVPSVTLATHAVTAGIRVGL